jgi:hypothetical protein
MAVWPSGKAVDCKFSTPSSNLGAAYNFLTIVLFLIVLNNILYIDIWLKNIQGMW